MRKSEGSPMHFGSPTVKTQSTRLKDGTQVQYSRAGQLSSQVFAYKRGRGNEHVKFGKF